MTPNIKNTPLLLMGLNSTQHNSIRTTVKMDLSVATIRTGFGTLPQELYDAILTLVFTAPSGPIDLTDRASSTIQTSLKLLRISSATRTTYATSYYSREFIFRAEWLMGSIQPVMAWVASIPRAHRVMLTKVTMARINNRNLSSNEYVADVVRICMRDIEAGLEADVASKVVYQLSDCA